MKRLNILIAVVLLGSLALAQGAPGTSKATSTKNVQRLGKAPVNNQPLEIALPKPVQKKLKNGLTVLILERHKLPTINLTMWIKSGALDDPKDMPGLATFTADMVKEGTAKRTSEQIANEVDTLGATLQARADFGDSYSVVNASGLSATADKLMDLMSDVVMNPSFPGDELTKYKTRKLAEVEQQHAEPSFLAQEKLMKVLYGDFPASVMSPTDAAINAASPDALKKFHDGNYVPNNAILAIAGDITAAQAEAMVNKYFGAWQKRAVQKPPLPPVPPLGAKKVYLVNRPGSVQANLFFGGLTIKRNDPDYPSLAVTNRIFGGGPAARLFIDLREEKSLTYGAYSYTNAEIYPGPIVGFAQVRNAVTDDAMKALVDNIERIDNEPVGEGELNDAQHAIVGSFALSLEQPQQLLNFWLTQDYYGLPLNYWDNYPKQIDAVTPQMVQATAKKYLDPAHLQWVCVTDATAAGNAQKQTVKDVLPKYGPVDFSEAPAPPKPATTTGK
jgi:zinc protease